MFRRVALAFALLWSVATCCPAAESPDARKACENDANERCPDDIPDREKVYACLVRNVNQLSPACKKIISDSLAPPPQQRRR